MDKEKIIQGAKIELARREFFFYCNLKAPDFYKEDREFLVELCNDLQDFVESDEDVCVVNIPPRHGKSRTAGNLVEWCLGKDNTIKIMTGSYNETLSTMFSKNVRNSIQETKADENKPVFSDVFPNTRIKYGDGAMNLWSLEGGYNNYLATSPTGTATGFGCNLMIIDDLIKSALEANNATILENHWTWFTDTMLSRLEEGGKIIVIMTRWHSQDLAGRVLEWCKEKKKKYRHISMKAMIDKEKKKMLCPQILSYTSYQDKISAMGEDIASANYQQEPIDLKGCLYTSFKTYEDLPRDEKGNPLFTSILNYTDTADEGLDYLCSITYGVYNKEAYILEIIYTQKPMEETEPAVAKMLYEYGVNKSKIESNNGGKGFARSIKRILSEEYNSNKTRVKWFHQSENKVARILSNATWIMDHVYYPKNWKDRWSDYHDAMVKYQREGKNAHDDAPDATTGIAENINKGGLRTFRE
ncbi:MAG: phage terminase large subunit [Lachnospiraceae bacterium]|nr:phage terminase large subunit [Lachnospiraceae bacterium]